MVDSEVGEDLFKAVGTRVRELREERGLSRQDFARTAGLSSKYVWRVEDGRQNLNLRTISRIALGLSVPMSALLEGIDADPQSLVSREYRRKEPGSADGA